MRNHHAEQVALLAELVKVPTDNPPGNCARQADVAGGLLEKLDSTVERHPVREAEVKKAGMVSPINLMIRKRFGDGSGPTNALNAHGDSPPGGSAVR